MTKEEALKAMIDGKKVRHNNTIDDSYLYYDKNKTLDQAFRYHSRSLTIDIPIKDTLNSIDGYEIAKEKVKKYRVVYKSLNGNYYISSIHYKDRKDFDKNIKTLCFIHLIEDSMIEVEEDE